MTTQELEEFAKTKHNNLPYKIGESLTYDLEGANSVLLKMFYSWLEHKGVDYIPNKETNKLEILGDHKLSEIDQAKFLDYIDKLEIKKVWEDASASAVGNISNNGNTFATLASTVGMKNVNPPGPGQNMIGSGDKWEPIFPPSIKKKKKEDEEKSAKKNDPLQFVQNYKDFVKRQKRK